MLYLGPLQLRLSWDLRFSRLMLRLHDARSAWSVVGLLLHLLHELVLNSVLIEVLQGADGPWRYGIGNVFVEIANIFAQVFTDSLFALSPVIATKRIDALIFQALELCDDLFVG